jgi:hypothetical protein
MPQMDFTVFFSIVETLFYSFFLSHLVFQLLYAQTLFDTVKRFISYLKKNGGVWLAVIQQADSGLDADHSLGMGLRIAGICIVGWRWLTVTALPKRVYNPNGRAAVEPELRWSMEVHDINVARRGNCERLAEWSWVQGALARGNDVEGDYAMPFSPAEKSELGYFVGELMTQSVGGNPYATKSLDLIVENIPELALPFFRYQNQVFFAKADLSMTAIQQGCMIADLISEIGRVL